MKEKYVILRRSRAAQRDVFFSVLPSEVQSVAAGITVETDDVDRRGASQLTRNPNVLGLAPSIPMKLIAPLDYGELAEPAAGGVTWGEGDGRRHIALLRRWNYGGGAGHRY